MSIVALHTFWTHFVDRTYQEKSIFIVVSKCHLTKAKLASSYPQILWLAAHFTATSTHSIQYLIPHHRTAVIDNPKVSAKQLRSNERLQYFKQIPYLHGYRAKQAILTEIWGDESGCFARFPAYIKHLENANPCNFAALDTNAARQFQAAFYCR